MTSTPDSESTSGRTQLKTAGWHLPSTDSHSSGGSSDIVLRSCSFHTGCNPDQTVKTSRLSLAVGWASTPDETCCWNWKSESRETRTESGGAGSLRGSSDVVTVGSCYVSPPPGLLQSPFLFWVDLGWFFRRSFSPESYPTCFEHAACLFSLVGVAFCCFRPQKTQR